METWEDKWNRFRNGVDEIKLDTPELIRKYAGIPGSSEEHSGYNTPGTDPEFIWKNLPDILVSNHAVNWQQFCSIRKNGLGGIRTQSARDHKLPGGFWFTVPSGERYNFELVSSNKGYHVPGLLFLKFLFRKTELDPKKTYWDGEGGGDEEGFEEFGPWDTDKLDEFWYNGSLPIDRCKIKVVLPIENRGVILDPAITKKEFNSLAFQ